MPRYIHPVVRVRQIEVTPIGAFVADGLEIEIDWYTIANNPENIRMRNRGVTGPTPTGDGDGRHH